MSDVIDADVFTGHFASWIEWEPFCMSIDVTLGIQVKKLQPISPKSAVSILPACVAVLLSAMAAPATPSDADVRFANTTAGMLACDPCSWRGILGIATNVENPKFTRPYSTLNLLTHPDKRTVGGTELAGGSANCNRAHQMVQDAHTYLLAIPKTGPPASPSPTQSPTSPPNGVPLRRKLHLRHRQHMVPFQ